MKKNTNAKPDYEYYLSTFDVDMKLKEFSEKYSEVFRIEYVKEYSKEGRLSGDKNEKNNREDGNNIGTQSSYSVNIPVITINLDGNFQNRTNKTRMFYDFGEHGREMITVDVAMRFLELLLLASNSIGRSDNDIAIDDHDKVFESQKASIDLNAFTKALMNTEFTIIPIENVNGRKLVEDEKRFCERKNGRGVDVNRNFPVNFGVKEKDYDPNEEFPGPYAISEPESKVLQKLFKEVKPHAWINVHSGMEAIFTPYDHKNVEPVGEYPEFARKMGEKINELHCKNKCVTGSGGKGVGYLAHGTVTDYAFDVMKVPAAYTWEIYGDIDAHYDDCFAMFNPVTKEKHDEVVNNWAGASLSLAYLMQSHPVVLEEVNSNRKNQAATTTSKASKTILGHAEDLSAQIIIEREMGEEINSARALQNDEENNNNNNNNSNNSLADEERISLSSSQSLRGIGKLRGRGKINRKGHAKLDLFGTREQDIDVWRYLVLVSVFSILYVFARSQFRAVKRYRTTRRNRDKLTN